MTTSATLTSPTRSCVDCELPAGELAPSGRCEACETRTEALGAQLREHYGLTCIPRWGTPRNFDHPTFGGKVAKIAAKLGTPLMPWQRYVADTSLEVYPDSGLFVYRDIGCTVPRQSGKTTVILPVCMHRGMAWQRQTIVYAAQSQTAAREKWEDDHVQALEDAKFILPGNRGRARVRKANGREAIIWKATRSIHGLHANTERSGHGKTMHLGMLDEFFAQVDNRIYAAWEPAMITVLMAQFWWFSTAGTSKSIPMNEARAAGRLLVQSGEQIGSAYYEWSSPKSSRRDDPKVWLSTMPALCPHPPPCTCGKGAWKHTVTLGAMRGALQKADTPAKLAEFDRAYRNISREDDEADADPNVPTVEEWNLLADSRAPGGTVVALAVDFTPLRDHAAILGVGLGPDGKPRLVVLDYGPGIAWVLPRCLELNAELRPVAWALDEKSAANTLIVPFKQAGITQMGQKPHRGGLWIPSTQELGASCASLTDLVREGGLVHLGQAEMEMAIAAAKSRPLGDGSYAFGRKIAAGDISPLIGGALGLGALERFAHLAGAEYDALNNIW